MKTKLFVRLKIMQFKKENKSMLLLINVVSQIFLQDIIRQDSLEEILHLTGRKRLEPLIYLID